MKKRDSTICVAKTSGKIDQPVYRSGWTDLWTDIVSCPSRVFNINITIKKTGKPRNYRKECSSAAVPGLHQWSTAMFMLGWAHYENLPMQYTEIF